MKFDKSNQLTLLFIAHLTLNPATYDDPYTGRRLNPRVLAGELINQSTRNIAMDLSALPPSRDDCGLMSCVCTHCSALI
ncbi:hypothetical protein A0J61_00880 [Choanephora cucurbitarum]|uniref:Uncharacterized protein n=1 Tax=Choanephora cucurbitarum TaxID=101091 RepID=A0A1C7NPK6_9FUNG|nr:hypothetical protein A0J61_00880 [Choanephora cucurbitarum]